MASDGGSAPRTGPGTATSSSPGREITRFGSGTR
jgi:hypothetical protein